MHYKEFSDFYDKVLSPYLKEIEEKSSDNCLKISYHLKDKIYNSYQRKKHYIKNHFMAKHVQALDGHKVAACFMYAILKTKIVRVNRFKKNLPQEILMANEYFAFFVAINIIDMYRHKKDGNKDYKTVVPITFHNDDKMEFVNNLCKSLYYIDNVESFDVFAYSTILFLLEKYTDVTKNTTASATK